MQQTTVEITEAHPISCGDGNKLGSPTGQGTSHVPISQPSPGSRGMTFQAKAAGRSPSGKHFFDRKLPSWLRRKGPTDSPQGLVVSRSRLCIEATHESPIQAVRKPTPGMSLGLNTEDATQEKTGPSLLRKLWCLKATNSKLKKPPIGAEVSPLQGARCRTVAALSRTADPHGESPLRWKPRAETQSPEEVGSLSEPEKAETARHQEASWLAKPWRTFRTIMATRAKKGSVLSGNKRNPGATGGKVLSLPAELETSPATSANNPTGEQQDSVVVAEDKTPPSTPPSVVEELCGSREDEGVNGSPQRRLESHRRVEAILKPVPKLPAHEGHGCCEDHPVLQVASELEGIQNEAGYLPLGRALEPGGAGPEDDGDEEEEQDWPELSAGEDLAELAENPGGQGMLMATRGWSNSEGVGGQKLEGKAAKSTGSYPNMQGSKQNTVASAESPREIKHSDEGVSDVSPDKTCRGSGLFPPAPSANGTRSVVPSYRPSPSHPTFSQEVDRLAPMGPCPSGEVGRGAEGSLTCGPDQAAARDPAGESSSSSPGSPKGELQAATPCPGTTGPEEKQKHLLYVAAVEIVGAAIDAATEQLAKKRARENAASGGPADAKADPLAGAAMQPSGWPA
ncbi:uncharacterized protein LOC143828316 [Paroedura picta]|uniref:uncharacterized protein LOC143828316 n=1 Tax=Paroedura picta TaxID=143630 RepID=UPI0040562CAF